jgi:hypothetical protein
VDAPVFFNAFRERGFAFRMRGVLHREGHRIVRKGYEKGGRLSKARR